ncbi:hypothetical protein ACFVXG_17635 [Kitasatospora sp. NPDC058162]|uniref:hypothetical protein n=1 Tax=Kitasatospora sp. NPDC058162 TaxID=3346362 RepID=UPI0036DB36E8
MGLTEGPGTGRPDDAEQHAVELGGAAQHAVERRGGAGRIEVEIGELVLDGFARIDHDRLTAAFRSELTRLIEARGVPLAVDGDRALDLLSGLPPLPADTSAQRLGEALARAVHTGLSGGGRAPGRGRT